MLIKSFIRKLTKCIETKSEVDMRSKLMSAQARNVHKKYNH